MKPKVVLVSTRNDDLEPRTHCPNCSCSPGLGMAVAEPAPCRRHANLLMSLAACSCGSTYPVYWRQIRPHALRLVGGGRRA